MEWIIGLLALLVGVALGAWIVHARHSSKGAVAQSELATARARNELLDQQARQFAEETRAARGEAVEAHKVREAAERRAAVAAEQLAGEQKHFDEQRQLLSDAKLNLSDAFKALGTDALKSNNQQFLDLAGQAFQKLMKEASGDVDKKQQAIDGLIKPIKELLEKQNASLTEIEKKRIEDKGGMQEQLKLVAASHEKLSGETGKLVSALRRPEVRGRWGEQQLRNVVELAGMTEHCDFAEQMSIDGEDGRQRPDMIVRLPGEGVLAVDSKVALDAYFDAIHAQDGEVRLHNLKRHAQQLNDHVNSLADKKYWDHVGKSGNRTPGLVVMFVSPESALVAAMETSPNLYEDAMGRHVIIATPTLLLALLRAVAYGWQQEDVAANAREISSAGKELYERLAKLVESFESVGKNIEAAGKAYDKAVGTLESRVLPSARKLKELHATTDEAIETPPLVEIQVRSISAVELKSLPDVIQSP